MKANSMGSTTERKPRPKVTIKTDLVTESLETLQRTEERVTTTFMSVAWAVLLTLVFLGLNAFAIWAYMNPVDAVEIITTVDVKKQEANLDALLAFLATLPNVPVVETDSLQSILSVFVKVFATLLMLTTGGLVGCVNRVIQKYTIPMVFTSYVIAFIYTIMLLMEDKFEILEMWFGYTYVSVIGCCVFVTLWQTISLCTASLK